MSAYRRLISSASLLALTLLVVSSPAVAQIGTPPGAEQEIVRVSAELQIQNETTGRLIVTAKIADGFHIYAQSQPKPFLASKISVAESPQFRITDSFRPDTAPLVHRHDALDVELHEFERVVNWSAPVELANGFDPAALSLTGTVFAQACDADRCLAPKTYSFTAQVVRVASQVSPPAFSLDPPAPETAANEPAPSQPIDLAPPVELPATADTQARSASKGTIEIPSLARRATESEQLSAETSDTDAREAKPFTLANVQAQSESSVAGSLGVILPLAFLAGFLLNFMPCVLPVVGLKVMSFVQQSGENRGRMFLLNAAYSAGLMSVMLVLASLAAFAGLGWGEQFSSAAFSITLAAIVFAFALSFLGVWEIPIPGLVGSAAGTADQKEGYSGAFVKGGLSTVLATPCSGPFLGSALTWAVTQPVHLTYLVFGTVGLGMASPYLLIGLFPKAIDFLPKPGNWMVAFKQVMGFVLLATVVYLMSFMPIPSVVPTTLLLLGVGVACWRLGTVVVMGTRREKLKAWADASLVTALAAAIAFGWLQGVMADRFERAAARVTASTAPTSSSPAVALSETTPDKIAWEPFSQQRLEQFVSEGRTVFVDFTADWCLTCKANEAVAIETPEVRELLHSRGIIAMKADKTEPAPEVDDTLRLLGNQAASIPFYAVFPADDPERPVTLDGVFTSPQSIVDALSDAEPGRADAASVHRTATTDTVQRRSVAHVAGR